MHCCIYTLTTDSNTSTGMMWVTLNMPSAANRQGISHANDPWFRGLCYTRCRNKRAFFLLYNGCYFLCMVVASGLALLCTLYSRNTKWCSSHFFYILIYFHSSLFTKKYTYAGFSFRRSSSCRSVGPIISRCVKQLNIWPIRGVFRISIKRRRGAVGVEGTRIVVEGLSRSPENIFLFPKW